MAQNLEISFTCIPLRSVGRFDPPLDATEQQRSLWVQLHRALNTHGAHNAFFLCEGKCVFHFANHPTLAMVQFAFQGTVLTDAEDRTTIGSDLQVELESETCPWLTAEAVAWLKETVERAVRIEFDRYIAAGDLQRTIDRLRHLEAETDSEGRISGHGSVNHSWLCSGNQLSPTSVSRAVADGPGVEYTNAVVKYGPCDVILGPIFGHPAARHLTQRTKLYNHYYNHCNSSLFPADVVCLGPCVIATKPTRAQPWTSPF